MGACQDCDRCTASVVSRLGRSLAAVGTLGITELSLAVVDAFKRTCPTCGHPLGMHAGVKVHLMTPPTSKVVPQTLIEQAAPALPSSTNIHISLPSTALRQVAPVPAAQPAEVEPATVGLPLPRKCILRTSFPRSRKWLPRIPSRRSRRSRQRMLSAALTGRRPRPRRRTMRRHRKSRRLRHRPRNPDSRALLGCWWSGSMASWQLRGCSAAEPPPSWRRRPTTLAPRVGGVGVTPARRGFQGG